ncbi:MAG: phytanoyl-CoA dioxygenase family protein [Caldilineaceae bacterium]
MLSQKQIQQYQADGYLVVSGLFSADEVAFFRDHYEAMRQRHIAEQMKTMNKAAFPEGDPLRTYPRIMQPHRHDAASLRWLIDARLNQCMTALLGQEPYAVQTMFYFKPPGARQALHQDRAFICAYSPAPVWRHGWPWTTATTPTAVCAVPGSQDWPVLCTVGADTTQSFTDVTVELPTGVTDVPVTMRW